MFDTFSSQAQGNINARSSTASMQNTDGDNLPDWRDNDDDDDDILTIDEDFNGNGDWSDDFTQGGSASPDYLFQIDNDEDGVADSDDLDDDNDGILDTDESFCYNSTISGNALRFVYQQGIDNPANAAGAADGVGALMYDNNDTLVLQLSDVLPAGTEYTIHWGQRSGQSGTSNIDIYEAISLGN